MTSSSKPATWYWVVSAIALVWNLMGVAAYIAQVSMSPEALQALPENERTLYQGIPAWATGAFALAVWGGALGSALLLLRRKWASIILGISLGGIVVQMYHSFFISNSMEVYGPGGMIMPVMVILIGVFLVWLSRKAATNGWMKG
jgi:hypothetical protein